MNSLWFAVIYCLLTISIYQGCAWLQHRLNTPWLNPMLLTILLIIAILLMLSVDYDSYQKATRWLGKLLEPAVVALGFPLFQQLSGIRKYWRSVLLVLSAAAVFAISISYLLTIITVNIPAIAVSLSLKSITTPIGIALTQQLAGNSAITAIAIIFAGLFGAIWGVKWLNFINVNSPLAQGLAIGTASHALGTATISQLSYQHAAYSSLALIVSATVTAMIAPNLIPLLQLIP